MIAQFADHQRMCGLRPATIRRRTWTLTKFAATAPLETATRADIERFIGARASAASRRALLADLRAFYLFAIDVELLTTNPTAKIPTIRVQSRAARPLTPAQVELAMTRARSASLRTLVMLGAYCGLRVSEMAALRWADVDFERGVIEVREAKGGKDRIVMMAKQLASQLGALPRRSDGFVIGTSSANVSQRLRGHFARLGIDHRPHDLRATFATQAVARSAGNITLVQGWLGHTDPQTTMAYLAWSPEGRHIIDSLYDAA